MTCRQISCTGGFIPQHKQMYRLNSDKTAKPITLKIPLVPCKRLCRFAETKMLLSV